MQEVRQKAAAILKALFARNDSAPSGWGLSSLIREDWLFLASIIWISILLAAMVWVLFGM
jgi:hypothetical protein